jgi:tRNA pseudouridine38-40 synthase
VQTNARTVQGELERAIAEISGTRAFELYGSGRTDAGVHALAQVAHLAIDVTLPAETWRRRLNELLPPDIVVLRVEPVPARFHARHHAEARVYLYQVARRRTAFAKPFVWWVKEPLDVPRMRGVAARLVGFHDFRGFSADDPSEKATEVLLERLDLVETDDLLLFHVEGSHFLWKMVRRLVGVLVEVGLGKLDADEAVALLTGEPRAEVAARLTAPASGLFLARVYYPEDVREPIGPVTTLARW